MTTLLELIKEERNRQLYEEGFTTDRDKLYVRYELYGAAVCYYAVVSNPLRYSAIRNRVLGEFWWPFEIDWFKPCTKTPNGTYTNTVDQKRCLIKAGALCLAELHRAERADSPTNRSIGISAANMLLKEIVALGDTLGF